LSWGLETLECRHLLTGDVTIPLDPAFDQFGDQVSTVMAYEGGSKVTFGIFDTGASAVTFGAEDQALFDYLGEPIPIKVPGGAVADGIGGSIIGDVSMPGRILADGFHASALTFDDQGFPVFNMNLGDGSAITSGIQAFVGTDSGSPDLPAITGTPILVRSSDHPNGLAGLVDMTGASLDFSEIVPGLVVPIPDVHFVAPTSTITATADTTQVLKFPLEPFGFDNYPNPGDLITESNIQLIPDVSVAHHGSTSGRGHFLFDTGSQLTILSSQVAANLGLDLAHPDTTVTVQGVGGTEDIPGFTIDSITLTATDGTLVHLTNVPIYVLDVADGVDGILGMNAFDTANQFLFNPNDPTDASVSVTYLTNPDRGAPPDLGPLGALFGGRNAGILHSIHGHGTPQFDVGARPDIQVSAPASAVYGQAELVQVTMPAGASGQVELMDGRNVLGKATLDHGQATISTAGLGVGSHSLKVHYTGSLAFRTTDSKAFAVAVDRATPMIGLSTQVGPIVVGQPMTVKATVTGQPYGAAPAGMVKFYDGNTLLGSATLQASGTASTTIRVPDAGPQTIRAVFDGDPNYKMGGASTTRTIARAASTTTVKVTPIMKGKPGKLVLDSYQVFVQVGVVAPGQAIASGSAVVTVGKSKRTLKLANGTASFKLALSAGRGQPVTASFSGDGHLQSSTSKKVTIPR
jgi:hypothetical protein